MKIKTLAALIFAAFAIGCDQPPSGTNNSSGNAANADITSSSSANNAKPTTTPAAANSVATAQNKGPYPDVPRINVAEAKKDFDAGTAVFIDTHSKVMFDNEHIKGAINIPFNEMESHMDLVPKGKKIITYCSCPAENTSSCRP